MSSFLSSRCAVYKIKPYKTTTDKKLKKTFSWLKNSVHVEPIWFSLKHCAAAVITPQWYRTRSVKKISDALKLFSYERDDFFVVFLKNRGKLSTEQQSSDKLEIPCGTKFLRVLILAIFAIFPAIREIKFPPTKINAKIFPQNLL